MRLLIKIYLRQQIISVIRPEDMNSLAKDIENSDYEPYRRLGMINQFLKLSYKLIV